MPTAAATATPAPAPQQMAPLPNSVFTQRKRPKDWVSRDRNLSSFDDGQDGEAVARHRLANLTGSWPLGEELDPIGRDGRERLEEEHSARPGTWIIAPDSVLEKESIRPEWFDQNNSVADTDVAKRVWIDAPESVDEDVRRSHWPGGSGGETPQSVRPGWIDHSDSVLAPSVRRGVRDDDESVIARSVRPGWIRQSGPEHSPSVRPNERDDDESVITPSVRPGWLDQHGSEISPSVLRDRRDDDRSVMAPSVRPDWIDQQGSETSPSVLPDGRGGGGDAESIGFPGPQQQPFWSAREQSDLGGSVRPGWMEGAARTVGGGIYRITDENGRSVRPGWMAADEDPSVIASSVMTGSVLHPPGQIAPSPRSHDEKYHGQAARSANFRPAPVKIGRGARTDLKGQPGERALSPTSPVGTMAGQCTSQEAERPRSELQDPLEGQSKQSKPAAPEERRQSEPGRLLHLLDSTDKRETERRRIAKEKREEHLRRRHHSLHDPQDRIEVEEVLKLHPPQQRPQQDSAEEPPRVISMQHSETMPVVPGGRLTTPNVTGVSRKEKRPPTPSSNPPHRASHPVAYGSSGFKYMSPSTTPGRAADRGSPHTPMTTQDSSPGSYTSSPSPRVPLPVTNPYAGSSPSPAGTCPGFAASGGAKVARGGPGFDYRGVAKVMTPSKGRTATARKTSSPVMVSATSPGTVRGASPVMLKGHVHGASGASVAAGGKAAQGTTPPGKDDGGTRKGGREGAAVVRFKGHGSSSSEESSAVGNRDLNPQDLAGRAPHASPSRVPGAITGSVSETSAAASPAVIAATTSPPDKARDAATKRRSSANSSGNGSGGGSGSKPKPSAAASLTSRILPFPKEIRARMSSGSSSASSGDGRKNSDGTPRRDREKAGRGGDGAGERNSKKKNSDRAGAVKKPRNPQPRSPGGMGRVEQATGPPPSGVGVKKMWKADSTTREAAAAPAPVVAVAVSSPAAGGKVLQGLRNKFVSQPRAAQADGPSRGQGTGAGAGGVRAVQASPKMEVISLSNPQPWSQRGRQRAPPLGTPGQRNLSRSRGRNSSLASVDEEPINSSPMKIRYGRRRNSTGSESSSRDLSDVAIHARSEGDFDKYDDKPDPGQRPTALNLGNEPQHGAPNYFAPLVGVVASQPSVTTPAMSTARVVGGPTEGPTTSHPLAKGLSGDFGETDASSKDEKAAMAVKWLEGRKRATHLDPFHPRSKQGFPRSSSMDDGSGGSFCPRAMFSPDRFNAFAGALSMGGSVDDSMCDSSVRSFVTTGTRNSSSTSLVSARGLSDRKLLAPQLSNSEKQAVARLKIKRGDVHFGYHTVRGSARVYKAELDGEVCAVKVLDILGMSKEAQADVFETFDAELLALSRLNTTNIVKVHGASVSSAEILVVSEFVDGGVLRQLLDNRSKQKLLSNRMRLVIAMDVAAGMKSLYAHGMQHRKLTSSAILLTSNYRAKIVGVGLSMTTEIIAFFQGKEAGEEEQEEEILPWASREVLAGAGFSEKSDVYSFGIVLWEMMQTDGAKPYKGLTPDEVVGAKYNGEGPAISRHCDPAIRSLMESCWSNLPADRPSFDKICDILQAISLDLGDQTKSPRAASRMAGGSSGTSAGAMSVP